MTRPKGELTTYRVRGGHTTDWAYRKRRATYMKRKYAKYMIWKIVNFKWDTLINIALNSCYSGHGEHNIIHNTVSHNLPNSFKMVYS